MAEGKSRSPEVRVVQCFLLQEVLTSCTKMTTQSVDDGKTTTNNISENAADIIFPNLQESMRSNNQRTAIINHQKHK